jgi:hypothetical protein
MCGWKDTSPTTVRRPKIDGYRKQKGDGKSRRLLSLCGYRPEWLRLQPSSHPFAGTGLLGLGRSRRYGAKRMLVQTHGVKHVGYFHQDQFPFVVTSGNSFSLNNANTLPG